MGAGNAERNTCLNDDSVLWPPSKEMDCAVDTSHISNVYLGNHLWGCTGAKRMTIFLINGTALEMHAVR